ncbi:PorP/SprF family type IX secretion system membrane protein, partial [Cyclobacteriaceae bacterium]|nr:PorP/SprF family type IX secretion system membrane protein [Cyclobacteriaceae bacterium]
MKIVNYIVISYFLIGLLPAQDVQFSQFYEADLLLNPALAGGTHESRALVHSRMQWMGVQGSYVTNYGSFDTYFDKYNSGFGAYITHDNLGGGIISTTQVNLMYSYETAVSSQLRLRFGLEAGVFNKTINDNGLIYPEQVTPGGIINSNVHFGKANILSPD